MNPKHVLSKIATMLSLTKEEVLFTYARLADGAIVESPTFDLGETVEVVTEEGKTPAPDGYHDLELKDESGNEVYIRVKTEGGVITERENVEEAKPEAEAEFESVAGEDIGDPLTEDTDMKKVIQKLQYRIEEMEKKMQSMEEQFPKPSGEETIYDGKGASETKEMKPEMMVAVDPEEEEDELPKLDGAPVEEKAPFKAKQNFGKKSVTPQGTFLSKLYN